MGETGRRHVNIHKQTLRALTDKRRKLRATSDCTPTKYHSFTVLFLSDRTRPQNNTQNNKVIKSKEKKNIKKYKKIARDDLNNTKFSK